MARPAGGWRKGGFRVEYKDGKLSVDQKHDSVHDGKPNELRFTTDEYTKAIVHTHGNGALPTHLCMGAYQVCRGMKPRSRSTSRIFRFLSRGWSESIS